MSTRRRGGALLAVLWLSAALSAIAFSVANTVRGETERTSTAADTVRAYYLATGAIDRAILYMMWGPAARNPDGSPRYYEPGMPLVRFGFPGGEAVVEVIPESSKLNINRARPEEIHRLLVALGVEPERAYQITMAIEDWRGPAPPGSVGPFDLFYLSRVPSFPARHASFEEVEELLLVKGMTPEVFYGGYGRDAGGRLVPRTGLIDCVSVFGSMDRFDANSVAPALMIAQGVNPEVARAIVEARRARPFRRIEEVQQIAGGPSAGMHRLGLAADSILTLRATSRPRTASGQLSDLRRSVAAMVKFFEPGRYPPIEILRWYDNAPAPARVF